MITPASRLILIVATTCSSAPQSSDVRFRPKADTQPSRKRALYMSRSDKPRVKLQRRQRPHGLSYRSGG
jgi:hypothetical protein